MRSTLRKLAKNLAYFGGPLPIRHAIEHRDTLTVVMFHRVLDRADPRWTEANPTDTVSTEFFADCLRFFRRHYNVVSLADVRAASSRERPLPPRALLITFDDGWADNLRHAAPLLRRENLPAVIFLAVEPVLSADEAWWQERVFGAWRALPADDRVRFKARAEAAARKDAAIERSDEPEVVNLVARLCAMDPTERDELVRMLPRREIGARMMMTVADLALAREARIDLGLHGYSHAPLTMLRDPAADIARARKDLAAAAPGICAADTLAYPHGRFDDTVQAAAERLGFSTIFTSVAVINKLRPGGFVDGRSIGRIPIDEQLLGDGAGRLRAEEMATSLFLRPAQ